MKKIIKRISVVICVLCVMVGVARAQTNTAQTNAPFGTKFFDLKFTVNEMDDGKAVSSREFHSFSDVLVRGGDSGKFVIRSGYRMPIVTGSYIPAGKADAGMMENQVTYIDVGLSLNGTLIEMVDGRLHMYTKCELSSSSTDGIETNRDPVIHSIIGEGNALIVPGKTTEIFRGDDVTSKRSFVVDVTATEVK